MSNGTQEDFQFQNSSGRIVHAKAWRPQGTPKHVIILVHGLGEHLGRYEDWAHRFLSEGAAVFALDTHGHGKTSGTRGHTESFELIFEDILQLIARARADYPTAKLHLYGHSMGGALVLAMAVSRQPDVATIVTTGPAIRPGFEPPAWKIYLAKILDQLVPGLTLANELDVNEISNDPVVVAAYKSDPLVHSKISVRWYNDWLRWIGRVFKAAKGFKQPVLLVHGREDKLTSPAATSELAQAMGPTATLKIWEGSKHELHNEPFKADVHKYIWNWITSC